MRAPEPCSAGDDGEAGAVAHVVGVRLEGEAEDGDGLALHRPARRRDDALGHAALAGFVDGDHGLDDAQRRAGLLGRARSAPGRPWESRSRRSPGRDGGTCRPMRPSSPMPRATSWTSAPTFSQRSAISLMKVILVARKALAAYFDQFGGLQRGEDDRPSRSDRAAGRGWRMTSRARSFSAPMITRSGRMKSLIAEPSRRNSGLETTSTVGARIGLADDARHLAPGADGHGRFHDDDGIAVEHRARSPWPRHRHRSDRHGRRRGGSACRRR